GSGTRKESPARPRTVHSRPRTTGTERRQEKPVTEGRRKMLHAEARGSAVLFAATALAVAACTDRSVEVTGPERVPGPTLAVGSVNLVDRYVVVFRHDLQDPDGLTDRLIRQ